MSRRFFHQLRGNESTRTPSNVLVFDTETLPSPHPVIPEAQLHRLRLWCATCWRDRTGRVTGQQWHQGTTAAEFWRLVYRRAAGGKPLYVFAHNLGFDATVSLIWRELELGNLTWQEPANWRGKPKAKRGEQPPHGLCVLTDPPTIIETWVKGTRQRVIWLDTMNWWRSSLEALGEEFGLPKVELPEFSAPDADWFKRCKRDVEITAAAVRTVFSLVRDHDCGVFKYTISAQSLAAYQHKYNRPPVVIRPEDDAIALERDAYRGGEVRVGYCGRISPTVPPLFDASADETRDGRPVRKGPVSVFDVQSFYPSVMRGNLYPYRLKSYCRGLKPADLVELQADYFCVADVVVDSPKDTYPVKHEGRSLNATGRFRTALCGPELARALTCGHVKSVALACWYDQAELFTEYVDYYWELRWSLAAEGKHHQAELVKLLLVSLFGKFGQRAFEWPDEKAVRPALYYGGFWDHCPRTGEWEYYRSIAGRVQRYVTEGESAESFPLIAAAVTSYGRERMAQLRAACGCHDFVYQDTDSLHCLPVGAARLNRAGQVVAGELGKLRLVGVYEEGEYLGPKDYQLDGQRVVAGVKRQAKAVGHRRFSQDQYQRLGSIVSTPPPDGVAVQRVVIQLADPLLLGRLDAWGRVSPPVLGG